VGLAVLAIYTAVALGAAMWLVGRRGRWLTADPSTCWSLAHHALPDVPDVADKWI